MAKIKKMEVDVAAARSSLEGMLLGSYLDSFNVSSLNITLRLINASACPGKLLYVDMSFSCAAIVRDCGISASNVAKLDFFMGRAEFLPKVYEKIGVEISGVELDFEGRLVLSMSHSVVELAVTDEDMGLEGSIWQVVMEGGADSALSPGGSVSCISTGNAVMFMFGA
jgi:hypothetical protein